MERTVKVMATKALVTVETLVSQYVNTGLNDEAQKAFISYCSSEYGSVEGDGAGLFEGITLTGKGDKAKGKLRRGAIEFKGGHNTALVVLAGASAIRKLETSINRLVGKLDAREVIEGWHDRWLAKKSAVSAASGVTENVDETADNED